MAACSQQPEQFCQSQPFSTLTETRSIPAKGIVTTKESSRGIAGGDEAQPIRSSGQSCGNFSPFPPHLLTGEVDSTSARHLIFGRLPYSAGHYGTLSPTCETVESICSHRLTSTPPRHLSAIPHRSLVTMSLKRRAKMPVSRPLSVLSPSETS